MEHHPQIAALLHDWSTAEAANDATALEPLLTDDFTAVGPRGFVLDRDQWLDRYRSQSLDNTTFTLRRPATRVHGDTAVTIAEQNNQASFQGHDASGQYRATLITVRTADRWQLAGVHLSPLTAPSN
jgi:ketosteroid isomerase-like protein